MKRHISREDKLKLILEYMEESGKKPVYTTVYKSYPIGVYYINLRQKAFNTNDLDEELIERMYNAGLLEKKCDFMYEKVERLEKFCKQYPQIWRNRRYKNNEQLFEGIEDEEEIKKIEKLLIQAIKDYDYIVLRRNKTRVKQEYIVRLRNAGGGYKFEDKKEIEKLVNEYGISEKDLIIAINKYGNLQNLKQEYINSLIEGKCGKVKNSLPKNLQKKLITGFDLSQPDFIKRENGFEKCIENIVETKEGDVVNLGKVKYELEEEMNKCKRKEAMEIIRQLYGLEDRKTKSYAQIAKERGTTSEAVRQIVNHSIKVLKKSQLQTIYNAEKLTEEGRIAFLRTFFEHYEIFVPNDYLELNKKSTEKIEEILEEEEKIKETIKRKIEIYGETLIKDTELKTYIVCMLNDKGINTINDLVKNSEVELKKKYRISRKTISGIKEMLKQYGLELKQERKIGEPKSNKKVETLELSTHLYASLRRNGIRTISDIGDISDPQNLMRLENLRGIGKKSYKELLSKMAEFNSKNENQVDVSIEIGLEGTATLKQIKSKKIRDTNFLDKYKTVKKLEAYNIKTLGDLTNYTEDELREKVKLNGATLRKIKIMLGEFGLNLRETETVIEQTTNWKKIKDKRIEELNLSKRVYNCLRRNGIDKIEDIGDITDENNLKKLSNLKGMGESTYKELISKIRVYGTNYNEVENIDEELIKAIEELRVAYQQKNQYRLPEHISKNDEGR